MFVGFRQNKNTTDMSLFTSLLQLVQFDLRLWTVCFTSERRKTFLNCCLLQLAFSGRVGTAEIRLRILFSLTFFLSLDVSQSRTYHSQNNETNHSLSLSSTIKHYSNCCNAHLSGHQAVIELMLSTFLKDVLNTIMKTIQRKIKL